MATFSVVLDFFGAAVVSIVAALLWWLLVRCPGQMCKMIDKLVQGPVTYNKAKYQPLPEHAWGAW